MKKQLIVSLIFLIISVSVLGVASYAWYSNNIVVGASGMAVSVIMPINVMASLDAPASVTSLEGFSTYFEFGSAESTESGPPVISEYDMLVPVTSSDGINFLYLPFRNVGQDGCPKAGTALIDYKAIPETSNIGYFIDIPLFITTTTPLDLDLYVKYININDPTGENTVTGAVRCAVISKESGAYRKLIIAKDTAAAPLVSADKVTYYPMIYDGTNRYYALSDTAAYESEYYIPNPELSPYVPSVTNKFSLRACETTGGVTTYYTTEVHLRFWVEGTDMSAVFSNAGAYFTISVVLAVDE